MRGDIPFTRQEPGSVVIQHIGDPSHLLFSAIRHSVACTSRAADGQLRYAKAALMRKPLLTRFNKMLIPRQTERKFLPPRPTFVLEPPRSVCVKEPTKVVPKQVQWQFLRPAKAESFTRNDSKACQRQKHVLRRHTQQHIPSLWTYLFGGYPNWIVRTDVVKKRTEVWTITASEFDAQNVLANTPVSRKKAQPVRLLFRINAVKEVPVANIFSSNFGFRSSGNSMPNQAVTNRPSAAPIGKRKTRRGLSRHVLCAYLCFDFRCELARVCCAAWRVSSWHTVFNKCAIDDARRHTVIVSDPSGCQPAKILNYNLCFLGVCEEAFDEQHDNSGPAVHQGLSA